ncbi:MAG: serine/threonine-protein kinase [Planctomycetota bacterium]
MGEAAKQIASEAMRLSGAARRSFLEASCGTDDRLRSAVERLIEIESSATIVGEGARRASAPERTMPSSIGSYRVLDRLGAGAMGVVYLAEQQNPRRRVALKVIRPDVLTPELLRRFDLETRALARLKHPGIGAIYDAGTASIDAMDCPYFAMELVRGSSLEVHAADLSVRERVHLVVELCDAVEHAHQRGIVHRDLKPGNILIDADLRPKVLDFGVACSLDTDERATELAGTVPYMSPEQLSTDPDIDARSDVYALGVILYELLTGVRPHDLSGCSVAEASAIVLERDAPPLRRIDRSFGADLEAIVACALSRDPDGRYTSAGSLAADLRRYLGRHPVLARPHSSAYMMRCYARRNSGIVAAASIALLTLFAGGVAVTWQAVEATRGWTLARAETERATAVNDFLTNMLSSADPENTMGADLTVRELLDESARTVKVELDGRPRIAASVRSTLATTYRSLGELQAAEAQAQAALDVCLETFGARDVRTAEAMQILGAIQVERGDFDSARTMLEDAMVLIAEHHGAMSSEAALAMNETARAYHAAGELAEALDLWTTSLDIARKTLGADHRQRLIVLHNYGSALSSMGRLEEAEAILGEVAERRVHVFGPDHPQTLSARSMLAGAIQKQGRDAEAVEHFRFVLGARSRILGDTHFSTLTAMGNLGVALIRLGQLEEAEQLTRTALSGYRERLGPEHAKTLIVMGNLAYLLEDQGKDDQAAELYRETIDIRARANGGKDPETWAPMNNLAMLLQRKGDVEEAALLYEELLDLCEQTLPADHYFTALFRNNYGSCLTALGRFSEAQAALEDSHRVLVATFGEEHPRVLKSTERRAELDRRKRSH